MSPHSTQASPESATACRAKSRPSSSQQCAFVEDNVFVKHVVICSVQMNCLAWHNTEKTREDPGSEHDSWAWCGHVIVQIKRLLANPFLQNDILCILHLFSTLLKSSTLVIPPPPTTTTKGDFQEDCWRKICLHVLSVCCEYQLQ